jgi:putative Holliday junction resolvase
MAYGNQLEGYLGVPVVFWDERLSTVAAEKSLLEGDMRRNRRRRVIDQVAACLILDGYLRSGKWAGVGFGGRGSER